MLPDRGARGLPVGVVTEGTWRDARPPDRAPSAARYARPVPVQAPYGSWPSPLSPEALVQASVGLSDAESAGGRIVWSESRPDEAGRQVVVELRPDGTTVDRVPPGFSARTLVHEYGGRCAVVDDSGDLVAANLDDQRLWRFPVDGGPPLPLTPPPPDPPADRYADPVVLDGGRLVACVRERHLTSGEVVNDLVALDARPLGVPAEPRPLATGHDFYAAPRAAPDGTRLAWLSWDHPDMPWDATELWAAPLDEGGVLGTPERVAGGPGVSISQPRFAPDGTLHWLSDETGFWNLHRDGAGVLGPIDADLGGPDWVFGQSTYTFLSDGTPVAAWSTPAGQRLGLLDGDRWRPVDSNLTAFSCLHRHGDRLLAIAASPVHPAAVVLLDPATGHHRVLRASRPLPLPPEAIARPEPFTFTARDGGEAHGLFYAPRSPTHVGPPGDRPPLVVVIHGGPTAAARRELSLAVQQWTTRGFAVADVDYRGSTGYGRPYRQRLHGAWGVADVDDCVDAATHLAATGRVDPTRMVIRGSSAGGLTVLNALARPAGFAAGASLYGVCDLASLATDTHKFEARYLDRLVGPWPDAAATYDERSPLRHAAECTRPVVFFQGTDDPVVPRSQSDAMVAALRANGVRADHHLFDGERHGFRQAATLVAVARLEIAFYRDVLHLATPEQAP